LTDAADHQARFGYLPNLDDNEYPLKFAPGHQGSLDYRADETVHLTCECSPDLPYASWGDPNKVCAYRAQDPTMPELQAAIDAHLAAVGDT
jgi:hypothetical protein